MKLQKIIITIMICTSLIYTGCVKKTPQSETPDSQVVIPRETVEITDDIVTPTTWTGNKVYVIQKWDFHVNSPLTIEPGAIIKFRPDDGPFMAVTGEGMILARGTKVNPCVFTSYRDDQHGGDTNGDQNLSSPNPGDWHAYIDEDGSVFEYCQFYYGGPDQIIEVWDSKIKITDSTFAYSTGCALNLRTAKEGTLVERNTFYSNNKPLSISTAFSLDDSNTFHNPDNPSEKNTYNGVFLEYTRSFNHHVTWSETEVPFVIDDNDLWINEDASLTLGDNVIIKFIPGSHISHYDNVINHDGVGVVFTSYLDDSNGGDTNGDRTTSSPTDNDWSMNQVSGELSWANVYYAGDSVSGVVNPVDSSSDLKPEIIPPVDDKMPVIVFFQADPPIIKKGDEVTLSWKTMNATKIYLDGDEVQAEGTKVVTPSASAEFELTAKSGEVTARNKRLVLLEKVERDLILFSLPSGIQPAIGGEPQAVPGIAISNINQIEGFFTPIGPVTQQPIYVRIALDSLYCLDEAVYDHGTNSDEPYLLVTGFATHTEPHSWSTGSAHVFSDVDDNENRRITASQRLVYEGEVTPDAALGFNVVVMENDSWDSSERAELAEDLAHGVGTVEGLYVGAAIGAVLGPLGAAVGAAVGAVLGWFFIDLITGGSDDRVVDETVVLGYEDLYQWSTEGPHKPMCLELFGGDEGNYELRWHLEFHDAESAFAHKFTPWDSLTLGNFWGDVNKEILLVIDDDAPGDNGRFYILNSDGVPVITPFDAFYTSYDRVAVGDVRGDDQDDIIVVSDDYGGRLRTYSAAGDNGDDGVIVQFDSYDGLAVGDVLIGETKQQIVIASHADDKVYLHDRLGRNLGSFELDWDFNGCRYTHSNSRHDAMLVGDVLGDERDEIVMIDNIGEAQGQVYVYNSYGKYGHDLLTSFSVIITNHDAVALGDFAGNGKSELLVATDGGDGSLGFAIRLYDIESGERIEEGGTRYWPWFTKYDGFVVGDVLGADRDQVLIATDQDNIIYIGK